MVEILPNDRASFIAKELSGNGCMMAKHRFGCRVVCRILEHLSPKDENSKTFLEEVLAHAKELCTHPFGSIVMRHFLEHGLDEHKHAVALALGKGVCECAKQRKGSHVVEAAFRYCSPADQFSLAQHILDKPSDLLALAQGQFGHHVIVTMLRAGSELRQAVLTALLPFAHELSVSKHGKCVYSMSQALLVNGSASSPSRL